ncbi:VOC family protein [Deinococcus irradiatisoli]|uniref:VOC family protein n=1 Tax=Deinococcus irradiatisoli TaxID=2202254 RepID=A0A2Z3JF40_9DEIO|nr:VOC family protein [Deinococcus irradiatisoli]AWN23652.1 VOC family protein [Deinococcus irradiatisoli]
MDAALDHLVVAARTLEEGAAWLKERLGVPLSPGGEHVEFGTHNRLLSLGAAYLEVIAVNPQASAPSRPRWFGIDTPAVRRRLEGGPALLHWVARTPAAPLPTQGEALALTRGRYAWTLTVPPDGSLPAGGVVPSLIAWRGESPAAALPDRGVRLRSLILRTPRPGDLNAALERLSLLGLVEAGAVSVEEAAAPSLECWLETPGGEVRLG